MALAKDKDAVEQFPAQGADHPLADRVRPGCLRRTLEHLDAGVGERGVEGVGELAALIADHELE
ncbi:MAG TPA: hypothetical protein VGZ32_05565 [Actinocrinis sp.]|uniref:hypothetical protein n=1 Tax=Actinocrinis sp. TaxID=1920516 RepID=UPI002DDCB25B|nr:hypothetical protein [Actinocrinis sp.]HEV3169782.1 hypothetical protein [Actinocrinis sp.]